MNAKTALALFSLKGAEIVSLKGEKSLFFQYFSPDLEQLTPEDFEAQLDRLESDFVSQDIGDWIKIYSLGGETYYNAKAPLRLGGAESESCPRPMEAILGDHSWRDVIVYDNYLTVGPEFLRLLTLTTPPANLIEGKLREFSDYVVMLKRHRSLEAKNKLDWKRRMHFSNLFKNMRDLKSENAFNEAEGTLEAVMTGEKALFDCEVIFLVKDQTKAGLDEKTEKLLLELKVLDAKVIVESKALAHFFQSVLPGIAPTSGRSFLATSDYITGLIPYQRDHLMAAGVEFTSRNGFPVYFDLFSPSAINYNVLITGTSGQGKSMLANKILKEALSYGAKVVCLDLGNSFRKNVLYHGGTVLSEKFNPLSFRSPQYLKEFVLSVLDEKLSKKDQGRLIEVISLMIDADLESLDSFVAKLETEFPSIRHSFYELKPFITDEMFCDTDLLYCDLGLYPDSVKAPLIIYLIECFKNMEGQKVFIFDECWNLLSKNAEYIAECFRTFRKHQASAVAISQNLDDFSETQLGRVIIQNTFYKFFFKQNLKTSEFISEHLSDTVHGLQSIKGEYSECLAHSERFSKPMRYFPTPLEYELFTSDRSELNQFDHFMEEKGRFLPFPEALLNYVSLRHPQFLRQEETR
jgi:hypothetical protein